MQRAHLRPQFLNKQSRACELSLKVASLRPSHKTRQVPKQHLKHQSDRADGQVAAVWEEPIITRLLQLMKAHNQEKKELLDRTLRQTLNHPRCLWLKSNHQSCLSSLSHNRQSLWLQLCKWIPFRSVEILNSSQEFAQEEQQNQTLQM